MSPVDRAHQEALLSDDVYWRLKEYILNEVVRPPDRLQIGQLSRHFGVSITPIREALIRLAAEHIIDSKPGRGFFYKEFLPSEQVKIHELLLCLLIYAVEKRGRKPFQLDLEPSETPEANILSGWRAGPAVIVAAIEREQLYQRLVKSLSNDQFTWQVSNLCERTRVSRILWLEQLIENEAAEQELHEMAALFRSGQNQEALELLEHRFHAKMLKMHALASTRQHKIYAAYPLLRPGSAR
jgi:DNA-binding GntR family transcriptional regulator